MPSTTKINSLPIALLGDASADITTAVSSYASAADSRVVPRFSTTSARDSAITSPVSGQMAAVTGTDEVYVYRSGLWVGFGPRTIIKSADETVNNSTTLQNDDELVLAIEANSVYYMHMILLYNATGVADFKWAFVGPSGWGGNAHISYIDPAGNGFQIIGSFPMTSTRSTQGQNPTTVQAEEHAVITTAGTAGTIQLQWAQNNLEATTNTLYASSFMSLLKVG